MVVKTKDRALSGKIFKVFENNSVKGLRPVSRQTKVEHSVQVSNLRGSRNEKTAIALWLYLAGSLLGIIVELTDYFFEYVFKS